MYAAVLENAVQPVPDGREILDVAWVARDDLERIEFATDMAEIIPAAFVARPARARQLFTRNALTCRVVGGYARPVCRSQRAHADDSASEVRNPHVHSTPNR